MSMVRAFALASMLAGTACAHDHTPLQFSVSRDRIIAEGEIDNNSLAAFQEVLSANPDARTLVLHHIGGSVDDEANVEFARYVRASGLTTLVPSDGLVALGGTDLFLAGESRVLESGACVGVHAWAAEDFTALDLLRSDPEHQRYLEYYKDIGIDAGFYWFTLEAAPADGMHWMTAGEAARFAVATGTAPPFGTRAECDVR